jgi:hypothetical protein
MVRFFWKQGGDGKEGTKSKILRVKFWEAKIKNHLASEFPKNIGSI